MSEMNRYYKRKEQGNAKRLAYRNRMNHANHIAVMLRGIGVGFSFITVMTAVAGVHGTLDLVLFILFVIVAGWGFISAEMILFFAEQTRYPKNRRWRLRDLYPIKS